MNSKNLNPLLLRSLYVYNNTLGFYSSDILDNNKSDS